jgi:hypothetical protein
MQVNLIWVLSLLWGISAFASDGVLEINQACAVNSGCFTGDDPGFPVTISESGSYRLTGSLEVSSADDTAIDIDASRVAIDLNGFQVKGPVVCGNVPLECNESGTGIGISSGRDRHSIRNGFIHGFGHIGINLRGAQRTLKM